MFMLNANFEYIDNVHNEKNLGISSEAIEQAYYFW